ncbi:hypothetical protein AAFN86_00370 [Roseomonas sp. CAU 1739]|uniref:hypothetical protein n=1 Tax=Roseomonas sp. CAU 1739 TaxID=3140364 RepID=UPI00325ADBBF
MARPGSTSGMVMPGGGRGAGPRAPRRLPGPRALAVFWGVVLIGTAGGAAVLQYLGPPEPPRRMPASGIERGLGFAAAASETTLAGAAMPDNPAIADPPAGANDDADAALAAPVSMQPAAPVPVLIRAADDPTPPRGAEGAPDPADAPGSDMAATTDAPRRGEPDAVEPPFVPMPEPDTLSGLLPAPLPEPRMVTAEAAPDAPGGLSERVPLEPPAIAIAIRQPESPLPLAEPPPGEDADAPAVVPPSPAAPMAAEPTAAVSAPPALASPPATMDPPMAGPLVTAEEVTRDPASPGASTEASMPEAAEALADGPVAAEAQAAPAVELSAEPPTPVAVAVIAETAAAVAAEPPPVMATSPPSAEPTATAASNEAPPSVASAVTPAAVGDPDDALRTAQAIAAPLPVIAYPAANSAPAAETMPTAPLIAVPVADSSPVDDALPTPASIAPPPAVAVPAPDPAPSAAAPANPSPPATDAEAEPTPAPAQAATMPGIPGPPAPSVQQPAQSAGAAASSHPSMPPIDPPPPAAAVQPVLQSPPGSPPLSPTMTAALMRRGQEMLSVGDISAARLLFERAAHGGSGAAAAALGRTYDPRFLAALGARGIRPDAAAAAEWYRRGAALGDAEATRLLQALHAPRAP